MTLLIYVFLGCVLWLIVYVYLMWSLLRLPRLHQQTQALAVPAQWPTLSVIIPACNEAEHIEAALTSLLTQGYPNLQIIVIDDRSTDTTGDIIERVAARDSRVTPLHVTTLPDGWLGKVHALHQGVQYASGDWLLFSDADIHFAAGALRRAMAYAKQSQADLLALFPRVLTNSFWLSVAVRSFGLLFLLTTRAAQVHRADNNYYIGIGAFNLVRHQIFERTPGFEWLRLEPGDDAGLGMMVKQAGGRLRFAFAEEDLALSWYPNLRTMFKGLEKNMFGPGAQYQWWRVLFQVCGAWALVMAPAIGMWAGLQTGQWPLLLAAGGVIAIHVFFSAVFATQKPIDTIYLFLFPVGLLMVNAMMIHAAYWCLRKQGIDWRGTHYSLAQLRAGQRVKF